MNFLRAARFIAVTSGAVSLFMVFPALWGGADKDGGFVPLSLSVFAGAVFSGLLYFCSRKESLNRITSAEAILAVAGSWGAVSVISGLPYIFSGAVPSFLDSLFEGVSGFTTTGATVFKDVAAVPQSILLWRSFSQWLGGIGIVVITLAVFPISGSARQMYRAERTGPFGGQLTSRVRETVLIMCGTYASLTCAQTALLLHGGSGVFDALTISFSTISTGGFLPYTGGEPYFAVSWVKWVTAAFMLLSAMNLTFLYRVAVRKNLRTSPENAEMRFYAAVAAVFAVFISLILYSEGVFATFRESFEEGFFHTVNMLSTSGFLSQNHREWPAPVRILTLTLMFCGGCAASAAGGISCARILVVLRHSGAEFKRRLHPRAIVPTLLGGSPVPQEAVSACFAYVIAYIAIFTAGFVITGFFGLDAVSAFSGAAAALGNVGHGFGTVAPIGGYESLPSAVKVVYIFLMLCGRLEIFTVLVIFSPDFWRNSRA